MDNRVKNRMKQVAFTLVEMLIVIAVIFIVATITLPQLGDIPRAARISQGAEIVVGALSNARMSAVSRNRTVEVRLLSYSDPKSPFSSVQIRAIQLFEDLEGTLVPLSKPRALPTGIIISADSDYTTLNSLPVNTPTAQDPTLPGVAKNYTYRSFRARPDGSFNLDRLLPASTTPQITVVDENRPPSGLPAIGNFATITIEPLTGFTRAYRP